MHKPRLAALLLLGATLLAPVNAFAGSNLSLATDGTGNVFTASQIGNASADIINNGNRDRTELMQIGGGRIGLVVDGNDDHTVAITGMCPPGSPGTVHTLHGNGKLHVIIGRCD